MLSIGNIINSLLSEFEQYKKDLQIIGLTILNTIGKERRKQQQIYLTRLLDYVAAETFLHENNRLYKVDRDALDSLLESIDVPFKEEYLQLNEENRPRFESLDPAIVKHLKLLTFIAYARSHLVNDPEFEYKYKTIARILQSQLTVPTSMLYSYISNYIDEVKQPALKSVVKDLARIPVYVSEVPTGVGKSFAYLVAHIVRFLALSGSNRNIVTGIVSTGTIALQEQLSDDIPKILNAIRELDPQRFPVNAINKDSFAAALEQVKHLNVQIVKGKGNYICFDKFLTGHELQQHDKRIPSSVASRIITEIESLRHQIDRVLHKHRPALPAKVFETNKQEARAFVASLLDNSIYERIKKLGNIQENAILEPYKSIVTIAENESPSCTGCSYADICYHNQQQIFITGKGVTKILEDMDVIGQSKLTHQLLIINHSLLAKQIANGDLFVPRNSRRTIFLTLDEGHEVDEVFLKELEQKFNTDIVNQLQHVINRIKLYIEADAKHFKEYLDNKLGKKCKECESIARDLAKTWNSLVNDHNILGTVETIARITNLLDRLLQKVYKVASAELLNTVSSCPSSVNVYTGLFSNNNISLSDHLQRIVSDDKYLQTIWNKSNSSATSNKEDTNDKESVSDIDIDLLNNNSVLLNPLISKLDDTDECLEFLHSQCNNGFEPIICSYKKHKNMLLKILELLYATKVVSYWTVVLLRGIVNELHNEGELMKSFVEYIDNLISKDDKKFYYAVRNYFRMKATIILRAIYSALSSLRTLASNPSNTVDLLVVLANYSLTPEGNVQLHLLPEWLTRLLTRYGIPTGIARVYIHGLIKLFARKDIANLSLNNIREQLSIANEIELTLNHKKKLGELRDLQNRLLNFDRHTDTITVTREQYMQLMANVVRLLFQRVALIYTYPYPEIVVHRIDSSVFTDTLALQSLVLNRQYNPYIVSFINITSATLNKRLLEDFFINTAYYDVDFEQYQTVFNLEENLELVICKNCDVNNKSKLYRQIEKTIDELLQRYDKVMVLFTAIQDLRAIYNKLSSRKQRNFKVFAQTYQNIKDMIAGFKAEKGKAVLLGVEVFWKGISIEGPKGVVITRIPFPIPEPISDKRKDYLAFKYIEYKREVEKKSVTLSQALYVAFLHYNVNVAIQKLKQGIGRAIRTQNDYATVLLMDNRVITNKFYGKQILRELYKIVQPTFRGI